MGRPRGFDEDDVLACAMQTFWCRGFEGTTTRVLEAETGVGVKQLNRTFGEKEALFVRALRLYRQMAGGILDQVFAEPGTKAIVVFFEGLTQPTEDAEDVRNSGCLMVNTVFELQRTSDAIREEVEAYRAMFRDRFRAALEAGGVPDAERKADYLLGSLWGALAQIRLGGRTDEAAPMVGVVAQTVEGWVGDSAMLPDR